MTRIELADGAVTDLDRLLNHLVEHGVTDAGDRMAAVIGALDILAEHPRIGRPLSGGLRELIIGRDARGYVALYRWRAEQDVVRVVAVRSQREAGYAEGGVAG